ncbi:MAG TPA: ABC transporter permease [Actinomycetota bacterium]|nr:ABC transporter permease [Actinomycetota bacterium]
MRLALAEIRRAKLRFGLLIGAVALLVFLILFQQTLASGLLGSFTDGLANQSADVLVFNADARGSVEASVVTPEQVQEVRAVPQVEQAEPLGESTFTVDAGDGVLTDTTIFGYVLEGPGGPTTLVEGRLPESDGEAVASDVDASKGYDIGDTVRVVPGDEQIRVVGLASDAQFNVQPTLYTTYATWERLSRSVNPDAPAVLPTLVAVHPAPGADPEAAVAAIDGSVEGVEAVATQTAIDNLPGVESISQSFAVILLLAFIVVVLVTWVFFLILTVQKTQSLTLLRAVGASSRYLLANIALQVTIVTVAGVVIASLLLVLATRGGSGGLEVSASPRLILTTGAAILVLALISSVASMRRVAKLDPFGATQRQAGGGLA